MRNVYTHRAEHGCYNVCTTLTTTTIYWSFGKSCLKRTTLIYLHNIMIYTKTYRWTTNGLRKKMNNMRVRTRLITHVIFFIHSRR